MRNRTQCRVHPLSLFVVLFVALPNFMFVFGFFHWEMWQMQIPQQVSFCNDCLASEKRSDVSMRLLTSAFTTDKKAKLKRSCFNKIFNCSSPFGMIPCVISSEMEKRNKTAQTQVLDTRKSSKTRNSRHIISYAKTA